MTGIRRRLQWWMDDIGTGMIRAGKNARSWIIAVILIMIGYVFIRITIGLLTH